MAKEHMNKQVHPDYVDEVINTYQSFGWELFGPPQEVYNKSSHLERSGDSINSVTETTHYFRINFQREKTMKNYSELSQLQKSYEAIPDIPYPPIRFGMFLGDS